MRLNDWVASIEAGGLDAARIAATADRGPGSDLIEKIAESLIKNASGVERQLLSKTLQETLFFCAGFNSEIDYPQFKTRFMRYLDRRGASSIIELFLSLYFFNFVWFETGESFRAMAWTPDSFEKDMEGVEGICRRAVAAVWRSFEQKQRPLDLTTARQVIRDIDQQLRGAHVPEPR